jgi:hypothetical protein
MDKHEQDEDACYFQMKKKVMDANSLDNIGLEHFCCNGFFKVQLTNVIFSELFRQTWKYLSFVT